MGPQRTQQITGNEFKFPFNLMGKSTMAFQTRQSWHVLKSGYTGGAQNNDFSPVLQVDVSRGLVSAVAEPNFIETATLIVSVVYLKY